MTMTEVTITPLIHEKQYLQLCAVHAINNLLQCDPQDDSPYSTILSNGILYQAIHVYENNLTKNVPDDHQEVLHSQTPRLEKRDNCNLNYHSRDISPSTKKELDDLADYLTHRQRQIMSHSTSKIDANTDELTMKSMNNVESSNNDNYNHEISWTTKYFHNHHRTPMLGNYTFEVLETALLKRNVQLHWFPKSQYQNIHLFSSTTNSRRRHSIYSNKDNNCSTLQNEYKFNQLKDDTISNTLQEEEEDITIGFIINARSSSILHPVTKYLFSQGHWYAITKIRRVLKMQFDPQQHTQKDSDFIVNQTDTNIAYCICNSRNEDDRGHDRYNPKSWYVIDSKQKFVQEIDSDEELIRYFLQIESYSSIFHAVMKNVVTV